MDCKGNDLLRSVVFINREVIYLQPVDRAIFLIGHDNVEKYLPNVRLNGVFG